MFMRAWRSGVAWLGAAVLVLALTVAHGRAQDKPPRPPMGSRSSELDKARADVCAALEQLREAEAKLREAEKRLRELEGKGPRIERAPADGVGEFRVFALKQSDATAMARIIADIFRGGRIAVTVDERTNTLIIRAMPEDLVTIEALLVQLDQQPPR